MNTGGTGRCQEAPAQPEREKPPDRRRSSTTKVTIGLDYTLFIGVGEYPDGRVCEVFLDAPLGSEEVPDHEPSGTATERALLNCWAIQTSVALQHGVPLEKLLDKVLHSRFEPAGLVQGHETIATCLSPLDLVARHLLIEYAGRDDLRQKGT